MTSRWKGQEERPESECQWRVEWWRWQGWLTDHDIQHTQWHTAQPLADSSPLYCSPRSPDHTHTHKMTCCYYVGGLSCGSKYTGGLRYRHITNSPSPVTPVTGTHLQLNTRAGKNTNPPRMNRTRTQVLPTTEQNSNIKTCKNPNWTEPYNAKTKQNLNPNVTVLTGFFHWMTHTFHSKRDILLYLG